MSTLETKTVWLPALFWRDHDERELPAGRLIEQRGNRVRVECTAAELAEIRSDAAYYSDRHGPDGMDEEYGPRLKRSAAATVRAVDRASSSDTGASR